MPRRPEPTDYFTPPVPAMTEAQLRQAVVTIAHLNGWRVFSLPAIKTRRPVRDAVGYPDLTLARKGVVLWIELKTSTGVLADEQKAWAADLGMACLVVRPVDLGLVQEMLA